MTETMVERIVEACRRGDAMEVALLVDQGEPESVEAALKAVAKAYDDNYCPCLRCVAARR